MTPCLPKAHTMVPYPFYCIGPETHPQPRTQSLTKEAADEALLQQLAGSRGSVALALSDGFRIEAVESGVRV